jgi:hypothetical protein
MPQAADRAPANTRNEAVAHCPASATPMSTRHSAARTRSEDTKSDWSRFRCNAKHEPRQSGSALATCMA